MGWQEQGTLPGAPEHGGGGRQPRDDMLASPALPDDILREAVSCPCFWPGAQLAAVLCRQLHVAYRMQDDCSSSCACMLAVSASKQSPMTRAWGGEHQHGPAVSA